MSKFSFISFGVNVPPPTPLNKIYTIKTDFQVIFCC